MGVNLHFSDDLFEPFSCVHWPCAYSVKLLFKVFSVFLFFGLFLYTSPLSNNMHCGEFTMDCLFTLVCFHEQFLIHSKISLFMPITFVTYLLATPKSWKKFLLFTFRSKIYLELIFVCVYGMTQGLGHFSRLKIKLSQWVQCDNTPGSVEVTGILIMYLYSKWGEILVVSAVMSIGFPLAQSILYSNSLLLALISPR